MEECSRMGISKLFVILFLGLINFLQSNIVVEADDSSNMMCNTDLSSFLPFPYSNLPDHMVCRTLWNSYVLRYYQSRNHEITIVLSTIYTSGWVGMGFSKDGKMLNSSCMVGWINDEGRAHIKQYHIKGLTASQIKPDAGELPLTDVPPFVAIQGATIYLGFQLKYNTSLGTQPVLLAFSSKTPHHHHLTVHDDKTTINFDFSSGKADSSIESSSGFFKDKRTHGTLGLLGWGLFLPVGAILARYLKHKDNLWYYLHVIIQFIGFLLGVAAVIVGLSLKHKLHASIPAHKGIGIFVLVLAVLQVCAFFWRPSKDSKYRKFWGWYHNWLGRFCLFFGAVNIALGIHIAGSVEAWKIGYGFLVGSVLVTVIVLETLLRLKRLGDTDKPPAFSMASLHHDHIPM
ncbi:hypothetical protein BUALT_Bualt19G0003100 [Buddleja alternifolia]|uniref:Cytochrome b561 and DOMON domain-containing protein n=1 Tax=Buddleja alternifolia TaxID=168488 RepID=A0AAV6W108_9LAMI|nr:hypothetical protein BUALT_Bualt19G0003100 [Buddleja alternifolia]